MWCIQVKETYMRRNWYFLSAIAVMFAIADYNLASAFPVNPHPLDATTSDVQLASAAPR
jgi:hypothetical protein